MVSADTDLAEDIRKNISTELSKRLSRSTCYIYTQIMEHYDSFNGEQEKLDNYLKEYDEGIGFQNLFWLFILPPDTFLHQERCSSFSIDQQIWLRIGTIVGQLPVRTASWKNQISFWKASSALETTNHSVYEIEIKEYSKDYNAFKRYLDSTERRARQSKENSLFVSNLSDNQEAIPKFICWKNIEGQLNKYMDNTDNNSHEIDYNSISNISHNM